MTRTNLDVATAHLPAPVAVVDLDAFDANLRDLLRRSAGCPIRVASKSVRCRALLHRALAVDGTAGLLCYSLPEALWLSDGDLSDDLVVGYPTVDEPALQRLAEDERARHRITLMIDSVEHLDLIDRALGAGHPEIRVCLELDVSWRPASGVHIGPRRSPVFTPGQASALARTVVARKGFRLVGVMGYEGHIAGVGDRQGNRVKAVLVRGMQRLSADELNRRRAATVREIEQITDLEFVNGGGTGSIEMTIADRSVTEVAAGSGLLAPSLFDDYSHFRPRPAALFALPVVRKPTPDVATLYAGGYVASGQAHPSRLPKPHLPAGLHLLRMEGAGEVQTPVTGKAARDLEVGDRVWLRHAKAGELAERFNEYHLISGEKVIETVPTYRGEGKNFG